MNAETTQVRQWELGDKVATTIHHIDANGEERIELSGVFDKLHLELEDRGHEMVLPERAREDHR